MIKAQIKLLVFVDTNIDFLPQVIEALELQRQDYLKGTDGEVDVVWEIVRRDLSNLSWIEYWGDNYGVNTNWIGEDTKKIRQEYGLDIDSVAYVFDWNSWTTKGNQYIWGWNLGNFYPDGNGYQVQLIKAGRNSQKALYYTLLMELFHAHDDFYYRATGKRLETMFNVTDFDEDVVHARHEDYEVFKYVPVIQQMKKVLIELFKVQLKEEDMIFGKLAYDPAQPHGTKDRKVWFLNAETKERSHVNGPGSLEHIFGRDAWNRVDTILESEFAQYTEVSSIGFKSAFWGQFINLINKIKI